MSAAKRRQQGFTIIEVLIVLAIAGVIMLIVLRAIPSLQRNGRNNQRKQDVAAMLEAVSHYELNNSGAMPPNCGGGGAEPECASPGGVLANVHLTYYRDAAAGSNVTVVVRTLAERQVISVPNSPDRVFIYNRQHCDPDTPGISTGDAAGFRDVVALYSVESSSSTSARQCKEL